MATKNICIRMDEDLKKKAEALFGELGMSMSTAFNLFVRQSVREGGIPFEVTTAVPNADTLAAFEEGERMLNDKNAPRFSSIDDLFEDLMN